jgi:hypothetical protein
LAVVTAPFSHFLNDTMRSLIASVYPILKDTYALDFAQIGMITLAFRFTASLFAAGDRLAGRVPAEAAAARTIIRRPAADRLHTSLAIATRTRRIFATLGARARVE